MIANYRQIFFSTSHSAKVHEYMEEEPERNIFPRESLHNPKQPKERSSADLSNLVTEDSDTIDGVFFKVIAFCSIETEASLSLKLLGGRKYTWKPPSRTVPVSQ